MLNILLSAPHRNNPIHCSLPLVLYRRHVWRNAKCRGENKLITQPYWKFEPLLGMPLLLGIIDIPTSLIGVAAVARTIPAGTGKCRLQHPGARRRRQRHHPAEDPREVRLFGRRAFPVQLSTTFLVTLLLVLGADTLAIQGESAMGLT